jgi:hypothetical protein
MCDVLLPPAVNPITVKYIYIYHIINLCTDKIEKNGMGGVCSADEKRGIYRRKRPMGRPRHRWEDNTRTDLKEVDVGYGLD